MNRPDPWGVGLVLALLPLAALVQPLFRWVAPGPATLAVVSNGGSKDPWGNPFVACGMNPLRGPYLYSLGPNGRDDSSTQIRAWLAKNPAPGPAQLAGDDQWVGHGLRGPSWPVTFGYVWGWALPLLLAGLISLRLAALQAVALRGSLRLELARVVLLAVPLWLFVLLPPLLYLERQGLFEPQDLPGLLVSPRVALTTSSGAVSFVLCLVLRLRQPAADPEP